MRAAGYSDEEISEIVGVVALNMFANSFNRVAKPEIDFPSAEHAIKEIAANAY